MQRLRDRLFPGPKRERLIRQMAVQRHYSYMGHGLAPSPRSSFQAFRQPSGQRWRNLAHRHVEDVERWLFDYTADAFVFMEGFGEMPERFIGGITAADRSWPHIIIREPTMGERLSAGFGLKRTLSTGEQRFDARFQVIADHHGFAGALLTDEIRSLLLRLPAGSYVEMVDHYVLFLVPYDKRTPFALESILDEFERKVPALVGTWPGE